MSASLSFDKTQYLATDTINFTVNPGASMTGEATFTGQVTLPGGVVIPISGEVPVNGTYGPFTAPGYTVTQDGTNPALFHAVPSGS